MGFNFDVITKPLEGAVKGFITSGGSPAGAFSGAVQGSQQGTYERKLERQRDLEAEYYKQRKANNMEIFGTGQLNQLQRPMTGQSTANAGFGAGFGQFLGDVGRNIVSPFAGLASTIAPFFGRSEVQQPAITSTRSGGAQESQGSGSQEAFISPGLSPLISLGRQFLQKPIGQIVTGTGIGSALSMIGGQQQPGMRITRKMKSQARMVLNMTGGNLSAASQILGVDENTLVMILLKRFRNDGPVVTKAALRKTKQTVRRLKSMCDMYDDLRPRAAARRRMPVRRSTTTLIKN
jgi:hypothetical protein